MPRLSVNIDHIARLRQSRTAKEPDPVAAAVLAELAGAKGITVHLRQDRRHIQERDVKLLRQTVKTNLNLEMGLSEDVVRIALKVVPDLATLVPETKGEITTGGGFDLSKNNPRLKEVISLLHQANITISLFINPNPSTIRAAKKLKADYVEIHTGIYARAQHPLETATEVERIAGAAMLARKLELGVNAGHDLDYRNVEKICLIEEIEELSIGHAIIARASLVGIEKAVQQMLKIIGE